MVLRNAVAKVVTYFRAGYAAGAPRRGYISLLALLPRRLTDDEVATVAAHCLGRAATPAARVDVGVAITRVTQELPAPEDVDRVTDRLDPRD